MSSLMCPLLHFSTTAAAGSISLSEALMVTACWHAVQQLQGWAYCCAGSWQTCQQRWSTSLPHLSLTDCTLLSTACGPPESNWTEMGRNFPNPLTQSTIYLRHLVYKVYIPCHVYMTLSTPRPPPNTHIHKLTTEDVAAAKQQCACKLLTTNLNLQR